MAFQAFDNGYGMLLVPLPGLPAGLNNSTTTLDAAGESIFGIGQILLSSGPGTSKTISAAGSGKIHFRLNASTLSNGTTNLRIGIQDVAATGLEDTTFDVYADWTSADSLAVGVNSATMETGSKTIAHGDLIAVGLELTARGGADSIVVVRNGTTQVLPYCTVDSGAGPAKTNAAPYLTIEFDDGTVGWFTTNNFVHTLENTSVFGTGSTPDEYALVFRLPFKAAAVGAYLHLLSSMAATDDFEVILYSDPLGTPVAERTITQDMDLGATASGAWDRPFDSAYTLDADTDYALALRPSTANALAFQRVNFGTGNGVLRKATMLGTNWSQYSRSDQTGAFGSQDTTLLPLFGVWLGQFDDGAGGGGSSGGAHIFGGTVIR